jgi:hypothetical protein
VRRLVPFAVGLPSSFSPVLCAFCLHTNTSSAVQQEQIEEGRLA